MSEIKQENHDIKLFVEKMKKIHQNVLDFIDGEDENESIYQNLIQLFEDQQITREKHDFQIFLQMISAIIDYHFRGSKFFEKSEKILLFFKDSIQRILSLSEIYEIFKNCERTILFLIEEKIINIKNTNLPKLNEYFKKSKYFSKIDDDSLNENINSKRKKGENDSVLCELIRNDSLDEFILFVSKNNINLNSTIESSIFETNPKLKQETSLIKYAAFYGSNKIFKYLQMNKVELSPKLWFYVIHGRNYELIHLLEENLKNIDYEKCFSKAVKCHHNEIADYFLNQIDPPIIELSAIKYYNFSYFEDDAIIQCSQGIFSLYNYFNIVKILVETGSKENQYKITILSKSFFL